MTVRDAVAEMRRVPVSPETVAKAETVVEDEAIPLDDVQMVVGQIQRAARPKRADIGDMKRAGCTRAQVRDLLTYYGAPEQTVNKIMNDLDSYDDGVWEGD